MLLLAAGLRAAMAPLPNVEPIMAIVLAAAIAMGPLRAAAVGFGAMLLSDLYIGMPGIWTLYTSPTYALIGLLAGFVVPFARSRTQITLTAAWLTAIYDAITSVAWALTSGVPLGLSFITLAPFAIVHITSNAALAFAITPALSKLLSSVRVASPKIVLRAERNELH
jgi:uncharacterized membrane protein